MSNTSSSSSSGVSFFGLLAVLFIGLKLTGYINWSWWMVTAPIWGPMLVGIVIMLLVLAIYLYKAARS